MKHFKVFGTLSVFISLVYFGYHQVYSHSVSGEPTDTSFFTNFFFSSPKLKTPEVAISDIENYTSGEFTTSELAEKISQRLEPFTQIKQKTLRSSEEMTYLKDLFQNEVVHKEIYFFLSTPPSEITLQVERTQFEALDFLELALKEDPRTLAEDTVRKLVSESQLENTTLPVVIRENLAEIQSELLLMITQNLAVNEAREIARGPASQKILDNIQLYYDENKALSKEAK